MKVRAQLTWDAIKLGDAIELEVPADALDRLPEPLHVHVPLGDHGIEQLRAGGERAKARGMDCGPGGPFIASTRLGIILEAAE